MDAEEGEADADRGSVGACTTEALMGNAVSRV